MSEYTRKVQLVNNFINPITGQSFNSGLGYHPPPRMQGGAGKIIIVENDEKQKCDDLAMRWNEHKLTEEDWGNIIKANGKVRVRDKDEAILYTTEIIEEFKKIYNTLKIENLSETDILEQTIIFKKISDIYDAKWKALNKGLWSSALQAWRSRISGRKDTLSIKNTKGTLDLDALYHGLGAIIIILVLNGHSYWIDINMVDNFVDEDGDEYDKYDIIYKSSIVLDIPEEVKKIKDPNLHLSGKVNINPKYIIDVKDAKIFKNDLFASSNFKYFKYNVSTNLQDFIFHDTNAKIEKHNKKVDVGQTNKKGKPLKRREPIPDKEAISIFNRLMKDPNKKFEFDICGVGNEFAKQMLNTDTPDVEATDIVLYNAYVNKMAEEGKAVKNLNLGGQFCFDCIDKTNHIVIECKNYSSSTQFNFLEKFRKNKELRNEWYRNLPQIERQKFETRADVSKEFYKKNFYYGVAITLNKFPRIGNISDDAPFMWDPDGNKLDIDKTQIKTYLLNCQGQKFEPIFNEQKKCTSVQAMQSVDKMPDYDKIMDEWFSSEDGNTFYILLATNFGILRYNYSTDFVVSENNDIYNSYKLGTQGPGSYMGGVIIPLERFEIITNKSKGKLEKRISKGHGMSGGEIDENDVKIPLDLFVKFENESIKNNKIDDKIMVELTNKNDEYVKRTLAKYNIKSV